MRVYDVIIVGGGAAGLSAALVLGRARRRVLVLDAGEPRNAPAAGAHGVFTRDGTPPLELLQIGREQLLPYETVEVRQAAAIDARRVDDRFEVMLRGSGDRESGRKLLLAMGVRDELPEIPGFRELWGRGVYHCPYCHGWEMRDEPLAVYANGEIAKHMAPLIRNWSADLVLLTDGPAEFEEADRTRFEGLGIAVREERVERLEGAPDRMEGVVFANGQALPRRGLFVRPRIIPGTGLAEGLGCALTEEGGVPELIQVDDRQQTSVPGVYAAGDVATLMQQVITAAAAGATAAAWINHELVGEGVVAAVAER